MNNIPKHDLVNRKCIFDMMHPSVNVIIAVCLHKMSPLLYKCIYGSQRYINCSCLHTVISLSIKNTFQIQDK